MDPGAVDPTYVAVFFIAVSIVEFAIILVLLLLVILLSVGVVVVLRMSNQLDKSLRRPVRLHVERLGRSRIRRWTQGAGRSRRFDLYPGRHATQRDGDLGCVRAFGSFDASRYGHGPLR